MLYTVSQIVNWNFRHGTKITATDRLASRRQALLNATNILMAVNWYDLFSDDKALPWPTPPYDG